VAVGNARVEPKGNAILVTKQASGSAKIVPLMAAFNAIALMAMNPLVGAAEHFLALVEEGIPPF
jgi:phage terminase large subunit-like protein